MTLRTQLLGGLWGRAHMSPVEDAGAAALAAEQAAPAPVDPVASEDHEAGDAASAAAATREADDAEARGEAPAEPERPKRQPWERKRIDKLTADAKAAQEAREAAEARAQAAEARAATYEALYGRQEASSAPAAGAPPPPAGDRVYTQAEFDAETSRRANITRLNERIEGVFDAGLKAKGAEWNTRINEAARAFGSDLQQRPDIFEALTALPNAADVYFELAGDLDHMAEVLTLPPVQLGMELARLSAKAGTSPKGPSVSRAPAPIAPLDGAAPEAEDLTKVPMEEYARTREAQMAARQAARR